jgi:hypothetical protein
MLEVPGEPGANGPVEISQDGEFRRAVAELTCRITLTAELAASLQAQRPPPSMAGDNRRFVRFACFSRGILECGQTLPAIERRPEKFLVLIKNLSRSGMCWLHEAQLFPRERCQLWMEGRRPLNLEVARCRRLHAGCYEIGAKFV